MRVLYLVEVYGTLQLVTTNKNTAFFYWWKERRKVEGARPDVYEWQLGKWGAYRHCGDQEISDYCNEILEYREEVKRSG